MRFLGWAVIFSLGSCAVYAQAPVMTPIQFLQQGNRLPSLGPADLDDEDPDDREQVPTLPPTVVPTNPPATVPSTNNSAIGPNAGNTGNLVGPDTTNAPAPNPFSPQFSQGSTSAITPTTLPISPTEFGGTIRIIDAATIANTNPIQLTDVLRSTAGLDVVQTGPPGSVSSVFLRGANSQHTKVLLNGIPLNEPSGPSRGFDFSTLSLDNVERIEVLQGPQSPLYGSDAVGGVINIVTRRGRDAPGVGLTSMAGSYGTHRQSGFARGAGRHYDYAISGSWLDTDGFSSASPRVGGVEKDGFQVGNVDGRFGVWQGGLEVEYFFRWIDGRTEADDAPFSLGTPPSDDLFRVITNQQFFQRVQAKWAPGDGLIEHVAAFDLTDYDRDDFDDVFPFSTTGESRRVLYQTNLQLTEDNVLSAGAEYWAEDAGAIGFGSTSAASQFQRSAFVQDQWELLDRVNATAGVRWDDHSAAGSAFTYRATLSGNVQETGTRLHGSIGTGFRAPALAENLFPFGNPNLAPERSRGWEYGLDQRLTDRMAAGAVYFRNDLQNLILFDLNTFLLENVGEAKTHGVEVTLHWLLCDRLTLDGAYTRTDTLDRDTGAPLVRRPRDKGSLALTWAADERTTLRLLALAVGARNDTRDGSVVLDDYVFGQLSARRQLGEHARWIGRIDNLFDQDYEEATGFAVAGFSFFTGLELRH